MLYEASPIATVYCALVSFAVASLAFLLTRVFALNRIFDEHSLMKERQFMWLLHGLSIPGHYLSISVLMGIVSMIAVYGYLGILCLAAYITGILVRLIIPVNKLKRRGCFTLGEFLNRETNSGFFSWIVGSCFIVVCFFFLVAEFVAAGAVLKPLLGVYTPAWFTILLGFSTAFVVFGSAQNSDTSVLKPFKSFLIIGLCFLLAYKILDRGHMNWENRTDLKKTDFAAIRPESLSEHPKLNLDQIDINRAAERWREGLAFEIRGNRTQTLNLPNSTPMTSVFDGREHYSWYRREITSGWAMSFLGGGYQWIGSLRSGLCQTREVIDGTVFVNGYPHGKNNDYRPVGEIRQLANPPIQSGATGPIEYLRELINNYVIVGRYRNVKNEGRLIETYYPVLFKGSEILGPIDHVGMLGIKLDFFKYQVDVFSFLLIFFVAGFLLSVTPSQRATQDRYRISGKLIGGALAVFVGILAFFVGIGAMTSLVLDPTNSNTAIPLLARSFGDAFQGIVSAILLVLIFFGIFRSLIAISSVVSSRFPRLIQKSTSAQSRNFPRVIIGFVIAVAAIIISHQLEHVPLSILASWALGISLTVSLPSELFVRYWRGVSNAGIAAAIAVGTISFVFTVLICDEICENLYGYPLEVIDGDLYGYQSIFIPINLPIIISVPLGFVTLVTVSLFSLLFSKKKSVSQTETRIV